ncbi:MAG: hypothetical protein MK108_07055 [Mariniblastus sp.]|nr:hypothetical protein [Mariniblastus sp.]
MRRKRFLLWGLLVLLGALVAPAIEADEPLRFQVKRQLHLPSDDGQQGIGTDGQFLFVQNSQQLLKYDLAGNLVQAGPKLRLHHGGIVCLQGKIYVAVSGCDAAGTDEHYVHVYDGRSLNLLEKHDIGSHFTVCAGGIAYRQGRFFVAESFFDNDHLDRIVEFDASFQPLQVHTVNFKSPYGIQGLEYLPATDQFQVHSHGRDFYRINASFQHDSRVEGRAEFDLQDVARLDAQTLLVNQRQAETVLFIELQMPRDSLPDEGVAGKPSVGRRCGPGVTRRRFSRWRRWP